MTTGVLRYPGRGPAEEPVDLVDLALELAGTIGVEDVFQKALAVLDRSGGGGWGILARVAQGRYISSCSSGVGPQDLRGLADAACGDQALLSLSGRNGRMTGLGEPVWHAINQEADGEPEAVLAFWPFASSSAPDRSVMTRAAGLIGVTLRSARLLETLQEQSYRDPLTRLLNRRGILDALAREESRAQRYERDLALLFVDLDRFKAVNDNHGHPVGDEVLRIFAARLDHALRSSDLVGRFGGDEFLIILPNTGIREASRIGRRLARDIASEPVQTSAGAMDVGMTFGAAGMEENPGSTGLLDRADTRMLAKKSRRRLLAGGTGPSGQPAAAVAFHAADR